MDKHTIYMHRAFELAELARGKCSPNPFVGAVVVKDNVIIGEGFTQPYGLDHAEVQAIRHCREACRGADMFVTLEPCSHYGKTPPCAQAIIDAGIKSVYIGISDPNPLVEGKGIEMLRTAGITVQTGLLADKITRQLEYFLTYIQKQRPFIFLKTAVSLDGRIAAEDGSSRWISCVESRQKTHELRQEADAVLTGIGTVLKDNPLLNVRLQNPYKQPLRIVLDSCLRIPTVSQIAQTARSQKTLVFTANQTNIPDKENTLAQLGVEICRVSSKDNLLDLFEIMAALHERKVSVLMLEAGTGINSSFLKAGLVDKLYIFKAPILLGGSHLAWDSIGIASMEQALQLREKDILTIGIDTLISGYPEPSIAD